MSTSIILTLLSLAVMAIYLVVYLANCPVPTSISATYYRTQEKWLFPVILATAGSLAFFPMIEHTPENFQFLSFFVFASILFVAASPAFKEDLVGKVHSVAASILALSAIAWIILVSPSWPVLVFLFAAYGIYDRKNFVFWFEVGLLLDLYIALIFLFCYPGA